MERLLKDAEKLLSAEFSLVLNVPAAQVESHILDALQE